MRGCFFSTISTLVRIGGRTMSMLASTPPASNAPIAITEKLKVVLEKIKIASAKRPQAYQYFEPQLLAVSKTKGPDQVIEAYDAGQRHFGENYVIELHEKANDIELQDRCPDIKWHFIGHLQRNKVNKVLDVPNLYMIEAVDSQKLAKAVNDAWGRLKRNETLNVYAQANTSREENKNGCAPEELVDLAKYIVEDCPHLTLKGLMTIGVFDYDYSKGPNPDFTTLMSLREEVSKALDIPTEKLDLSMGMSADFEQAIEAGSTIVRIGSQIFGPRPKKVDPSSANANGTSVDGSTEGVKNISLS